MFLKDEEKRMLDGSYGPGIQRCMSLLVRWGEIFDAERMVKVNHVHASTNYPAEALMEMAEGSNGVMALTTTHAVFDPGYWKEHFGLTVGCMAGGYVTVDETIFADRMKLLRGFGVLPTFTCAPYTIGILPRGGDVLCMTGSSGQVISNSFFGSRAGRESVSTCFAAAIAGRTPEIGVLATRNRYAQLLVKVATELGVDQFTEADYGALGYCIGAAAADRNVAVDGLPPDMKFEHGRMLVSPLPVSGACVLCHIIGVTPEARTTEEALGGGKAEVLEVGKKEILNVYRALNDSTTRDVDAVVIGCPHLMITEIRDLARLIKGSRVSPNVRLVIGVAEPMLTFSQKCGYKEDIERAGGTFVNSCISALNPFIYIDNPAKCIATNSARAAHYMQRMSGGKTKTFYGEMKKCIQAAITGKWEH